MARISVAELLRDPDFVDVVTVIRMTESVSEEGMVSYAEERFRILASIQSAGGDDLTVTPDLARTGGTYEINTTFPLATASDLTKADTVLWRDAEFVVIAVSRFGNFGSHYEGVMAIKTISPRTGPP